MQQIQEISIKIYDTYKEDAYFFPLIGAVIEGKQSGAMFSFSSGDAVYVEHSFGFAQILGEMSSHNKEEFVAYLEQKAFLAPKVRLYKASMQNIYTSFPVNTHSERQRFHILSTPSLENSHDIRAVSAENIDEVDATFQLVERFWNTKSDFIKYSHAQILYIGSKPVSICCAAALANNCAEIDILTHEDFRHKGYASLVAKAFIKTCKEKGITPLWDCFTNNAGSMELCKSLGFTAKTPPYKFLTIAK